MGSEDLREIEGSSHPSKSQGKRDRQAIQALAERLINRPLAELERLDLSESVRAAVAELARIRDLRARRRQIKRIAALLASEDLGAIQALIADQEALQRAESARLHRLERWRERLLSEGDRALSELADRCPEIDCQHLRALIRAAQRDCACGKTAGLRRLFRFLRETLPDPMP